MIDEPAISATDDLCSALAEIIEAAPEEMRTELAGAIDAFSDEFLHQPCDVEPLTLVRVLFAAMDKACGGPGPLTWTLHRAAGRVCGLSIASPMANPKRASKAGSYTKNPSQFLGTNKSVVRLIMHECERNGAIR